jgi:hypothetical protein
MMLMVTSQNLTLQLFITNFSTCTILHKQAVFYVEKQALEKKSLKKEL